ncbi:MAG: hypothetical protein K0S32_1269 [Bacteroidetes bacterium]|jgi:hypothetical protein|nr:hypothetical protein [Bacteroidota bacterium]MDF2457579.1 hypothetical protein [Cytophagaceae bacterium]
MKSIFKIVLPVIAIVVFTACAALSAKEIARIAINKISNEENLDWKSTSIDLKKGEKLWLWTDLDIEYEGELGLEYQVLVIRDSDTLRMVKLNPLKCNVKMFEKTVSIMNKTTQSYEGSMEAFEIADDGKYTFNAILVSNHNETLKLTKADLVLKK